jgi:hypothetical protein
MHRSVVLAEHIAAALDDLLYERASRPAGTAAEPTPRIDIAVVHRDVNRSSGEPVPTTRKLVAGEGSILPPPSMSAAEHAGDIGAPSVRTSPPRPTTRDER